MLMGDTKVSCHLAGPQLNNLFHGAYGSCMLSKCCSSPEWIYFRHVFPFLIIDPRCLANPSIRSPAKAITSWAQFMVASSGTCAWHQVDHNHGLQAHVSKTTYCKYAHILLPGPMCDLVAQHLIRAACAKGTWPQTWQVEIQFLIFMFDRMWAQRNNLRNWKLICR